MSNTEPTPEPKKHRDWWALSSSIMAVLGWALIIIYYIIILLKPQPVEIKDIQVTQRTVQIGTTADIRVFTTGGDDKELQYIWAAQVGTIGEQPDPFQRYEDKVTYVAPKLPGADVITIVVYDNEGKEARDFVIVTIVERGER